MFIGTHCRRTKFNNILRITQFYYRPTGSRGLLIDLLIRMKSPSIKTNIRQIIVKLTELYSNI